MDGQITAWSRDLFDGGASVVARISRCAYDGALEVVSFDGMSADDMKATNAAVVQAARA